MYVLAVSILGLVMKLLNSCWYVVAWKRVSKMPSKKVSGTITVGFGQLFNPATLKARRKRMIKLIFIMNYIIVRFILRSIIDNDQSHQVL